MCTGDCLLAPFGIMICVSFAYNTQYCHNIYNNKTWVVFGPLVFEHLMSYCYIMSPNPTATEARTPRFRGHIHPYVSSTWRGSCRAASAICKGLWYILWEPWLCYVSVSVFMCIVYLDCDMVYMMFHVETDRITYMLGMDTWWGNWYKAYGNDRSRPVNVNMCSSDSEMVCVLVWMVSFVGWLNGSNGITIYPHPTSWIIFVLHPHH